MLRLAPARVDLRRAAEGAGAGDQGAIGRAGSAPRRTGPPPGRVVAGMRSAPPGGGVLASGPVAPVRSM